MLNADFCMLPNFKFFFLFGILDMAYMKTIPFGSILLLAVTVT